MKVLHFLKTPVGARWAFRQIRDLVAIGHDVHVALPAGPLSADLASVGARIHEVNVELSLRSPHLNIQRFSQIRDLVRLVSPDIIHSHFVSTTIALRCALGPRHPVKRVFHVPGPLHLENSLLGRLEVSLSGEADYWLASCEFTREKYISLGVSESRVGLVYYGVDDWEFSQQRTGHLRREFGIDPSSFIVGNVSYFYPPKLLLGQLYGIKGHEDLLAAIELLGERCPDSVFLFIGSGFGRGSLRYYNSIKRRASRLKGSRIIFTGYRSDVGLLYPDIDLAVHPSRSDNVGGAVESLMCMVPTLCTDIGGFPDLVRPGQTGWLCQAGNPQDMARQILEIYSLGEKRRQSVRENGYQLASEIMNSAANANALSEFYEELMS